MWLDVARHCTTDNSRFSSSTPFAVRHSRQCIVHVEPRSASVGTQMPLRQRATVTHSLSPAA
ncbi:hypothetical protein JB92DRAFT_2987800 [Gautieria morchelliformis]|nr:hypothetical protein JB92DRAFT_2987800 [Gautieria morchelliformis]